MVSKKSKRKIDKPLLIFSLVLTVIILYGIFRVLLFPLFSIFTSNDTLTSTPLITENDLTALLEERDSWERAYFYNFSLQLPEFKRLDNDTPDQNVLVITDPKSKETLTLSIATQQTEATSITDLIPEDPSDLYGFTVIGQYDALRVGPLDPPYDSVVYFVLVDDTMYEITAKFSTPVSFLDQVLSSFEVN